MIILIKLILLSIIVFQITQIIVESKLFENVRQYFYLPDSTNMLVIHIHTIIYNIINCFLCCSVWVSFIVLLFVLNNFNIMYDLFEIRNIFISTFLDTMLVSGIAWFLHCLENNWTK